MKKLVVLIVLMGLVGTMLAGGCAKDSEQEMKAETKVEKNESTDDEEKAEAVEESGDDEIVIAYISKALDQVWFINEGNGGVKDTAITLGAKDVLLIDAKMNPDTYLSALDNVIAQEVDGIIVCTPDQQLSQATVTKAESAGIPLLAIDDPLQDGEGNLMSAFIGLDAYKIGEACGNWMADYVEANDLMSAGESVGLLLLTMDTVSSCVPRTEGEYDSFTTRLPDFPEEQIFRSDYNGETEKGFDAAAAIITANPQIETWMVMTANDEGAIGATRAMEQADLDEKAIVVGLGGYLCDGEFEKESTSYKASAYLDSYAEGKKAASLMMMHLLNGEPLPEQTKFGAIMVTKENYKEIKGIE